MKKQIGNKLFAIFTILLLLSLLIYTGIEFLESKKLAKRVVNLSTPISTNKEVFKSKNTISAWVPNWRQEEALDSIMGVDSEKLKEILPVWYKINTEGKIIKDEGDRSSQIKEIARYKKIDILPTQNNVDVKGFNSGLVSKMLSDQQSAIDFIVTETITNNYVGWDLDLEEISHEDKEKYVDFVSQLSERLHKNNKKLSVTLHAQDGKDKWSGTKGQNMKELGLYADEVRIMAYDFHNSNTNSGPITPIQDLKNTIEYTLANVEKDKVIICIPSYGYNWTSSEVVPMQYIDAENFVGSNNLITSRDDSSYEMTVSYNFNNQKGVVWYQDFQTLISKIEVINKYEIYNICFWHLGGEDQKFWKNIQ